MGQKDELFLSWLPTNATKHVEHATIGIHGWPWLLHRPERQHETNQKTSNRDNMLFGVAKQSPESPQTTPHSVRSPSHTVELSQLPVSLVRKSATELGRVTISNPLVSNRETLQWMGLWFPTPETTNSTHFLRWKSTQVKLFVHLAKLSSQKVYEVQELKK